MSRIKANFYDWLVGSLFLLVPIVIFWQKATSLKAQGVTTGGPMNNAAMFPSIIAWLMLGLALINLSVVFFKHSPKLSYPHTKTTKLALLFTAIFIVYIGLLPTLGYHLLTPIAIAIQLKILGCRTSSSILGGLSMSLIVAGVFQGLLNVILPVGILNFTIFG